MASQHVMIIDDEPGILALCERVLGRAGFSTSAFSDPMEALNYLQETRMDLLIVDIRMPRISGFEVIERAKVVLPDMAILVMTDFGTVETAIQALRQGVDGLILKPFENKEELIRAARQAISDNQTKRDVARMLALRPLFDITESLISETRPERLLELIVNAVCGHLQCDNAGYYQFSSEDNCLHLLHGKGDVLPDQESGRNSGPLGKADALGVPVWINAHGDESVNLSQAEKSSLKAIICVPTSMTNVRNVIYAGRSIGELPFREVDVEMLLILARQATIAMENARLYGDLRAYVKRVEESQQALLQAEKLATAGRLTASIAHEINNPLQAVHNCLHLAGRGDLTSEKRQEYFDLAESELQRLMTTVQRMLEFYRPSKLSLRRTNLSELLVHVLTLMSRQLADRNIRVTTLFPDRDPIAKVVTDQIQQVFINLILNAFDAMADGGELTISIQSVDKKIEVDFQDSGPGVAPGISSSLFEPFTSTKEAGTGLGLSVSYNIISAHGGNLLLVPGNGRGACFRVSLPAGE